MRMLRCLWFVLLAGPLSCIATHESNGSGQAGNGNQVNTGPSDPNQPAASPNQMTGNPNDPNNAANNPNSVSDPNNTELPPPPLLGTFTQGLWRGEDVRISQANGFYYSVYSVGGERRLFKSASLIDRGEGKHLPPNFPLYAPQWIDRIGDVTYNAWFAFDGTVWRCDCVDPYDNMDQWKWVKSIPFTAVSLDFEVFRNPQPGPYSGHWYMVWAGATYGTVGWGPESLYISEVLDLRPDMPTLANANNTSANGIVSYHSSNWSGVVVEGPGAFITGTQVSLVYSGNGAQTDDYALGIAVLKPGHDPGSAYSWIDHNYGGCDDNRYGPEFAQTANVVGPGVARHIQSSDGNEDWLLYHSKIWETYQANDGPADQQSHNQQWTRQVMLQPMGWRQQVCDGNTYVIPKLGVPVPAGQSQTAPGGDRGFGPLASAFRAEAELWLPYGAVMGQSIQSIQGPNGNLDVISPDDPNCSAGRRITYLNALAGDTNTTPKRSGLVWHNAPPASGLQIAASTPMAANLDLYINGTQVTTLDFAPTPNASTFAVKSVGVNIPRGATVELRYEQGKSVAPDLDYIDFMP